MNNQDTLWLAPLQGLTEYHFRNIYGRFFSGIDAAVLPFVTLVEGRNVKIDHIKDVWKEHNSSTFQLIPQVLGNDGPMFSTMNRRLAEMGYGEVNWNLGCPAPRVVFHKHGSGFLPYYKQVERVLDTIFQNPPVEISIKMRLGYETADDIEALIPILNCYPLKSICIHPRLGTQMYEGEVDLNTFRHILPEIRHDIIYNGDIFTIDDFRRMKQLFPQIDQWMIGRGVFRDPFLPEKIKGIYYETADSAKIRFEKFHQALFETVMQRSNFERNALNKMKEYWHYYSKLYEEPAIVFDKIKTCATLHEMQRTFLYIFDNDKLK